MQSMDATVKVEVLSDVEEVDGADSVEPESAEATDDGRTVVFYDDLTQSVEDDEVGQDEMLFKFDNHADDGISAECDVKPDQSVVEFYRKVIQNENGYLYLEMGEDEDLVDFNRLQAIDDVTGKTVFLIDEVDSSNDNNMWTFYGRRNRVFGNAMCETCGQTFVNTARLERHLSVHQYQGSFKCLVCGKTFKYEYNLFHHWRQSCPALRLYLANADLETMDHTALRASVNELAKKRFGAVGGSGQINGPSIPHEQCEISFNGEYLKCNACGITVSKAYSARHQLVHRGEVDFTSPCDGYYYCDICGMKFKQFSNVLKHWQSLCVRIREVPGYSEKLCDVEMISVIGKHLLSFNTGPALSDSKFPNFQPAPVIKMLPKQCRQCYKVFATRDRLDRHLAGHHTSNGSHSCPLCGNRFKQLHDLLIHYRRQCIYTKACITEEDRTRMDAANLRRRVRHLANNEFDRQRAIEFGKISADLEATMAAEAATGGEPVNAIQGGIPQVDINKVRDRRRKSRVYLCPFCRVHFFGMKIVERHIKAAHPGQNFYYDNYLGRFVQVFPEESDNGEQNEDDAAAADDCPVLQREPDPNRPQPVALPSYQSYGPPVARPGPWAAGASDFVRNSLSQPQQPAPAFPGYRPRSARQIPVNPKLTTMIPYNGGGVRVIRPQAIRDSIRLPVVPLTKKALEEPQEDFEPPPPLESMVDYVCNDDDEEKGFHSNENDTQYSSVKLEPLDIEENSRASSFSNPATATALIYGAEEIDTLDSTFGIDTTMDIKPEPANFDLEDSNGSWSATAQGKNGDSSSASASQAVESQCPISDFDPPDMKPDIRQLIAATTAAVPSKPKRQWKRRYPSDVVPRRSARFSKQE